MTSSDRLRMESHDDDLSDFFDNAALGLHWVDSAGIILRVNDAELKLLGYVRDEYIGRNIAEFHVDADVVTDILGRLRNGETLRDYPAQMRCKDGSVRNVRITSNVKWEDGMFLHTRCITRDVEHEREDVRNRLAAIVESSDDAIISKSLDGTIQSWNAAAQRIFGYTAAEAIGQPITLIIPQELHGEEKHFLARLSAGERIDHYDTTRLAKGGYKRYVSLTISPIRDAQGRVIAASKIARDITARRHAEQELLEVARRKDEFIAVLAHELRNPLAPISSSLELLRFENTNSELALKARTIIERQVHHLVRLVDDLLEASRISKGKIELQSKPLDLSAVMLGAIETSRPFIELGKHRLDLSLPTQSLTVEGDFVRLAQVLSNLLNNATKYTEPGGKISVTAEAVNGFAVIAVRDTGIGIESSMLDKIFEMFVQVGKPGQRVKSGLGVGLSLCRSLVELHGGEIRARSDGLGKGSTFEVRLPLIKSESRKAAPNPEPKLTSSNSSRRVLVVDDNVDAAESLALILTSMGHQVRVAHSGRGALEGARAERPDVILLDIGMPEIDGLEVVRRLRTEPEFQNVRIAAITGFGRQDDIERSKRAGFDDHLVKPVSADELRILMANRAP